MGTRFSLYLDSYTTKAWRRAVKWLRDNDFDIDKFGRKESGYAKWAIELMIKFVEKKSGKKMYVDEDEIKPEEIKIVKQEVKE
ncbi:MAG: hypothetical protein ACTSX6_00340 [Candidatus Heimdallarchaeaceae archaeon]